MDGGLGTSLHLIIIPQSISLGLNAHRLFELDSMEPLLILTQEKNYRSFEN